MTTGCVVNKKFQSPVYLHPNKDRVGNNFPKHKLIVPTLCVGMRSGALRHIRDAARPALHSHAARGNEGNRSAVRDAGASLTGLPRRAWEP